MHSQKAGLFRVSGAIADITNSRLAMRLPHEHATHASSRWWMSADRSPNGGVAYLEILIMKHPAIFCMRALWTTRSTPKERRGVGMPHGRHASTPRRARYSWSGGPRTARLGPLNFGGLWCTCLIWHAIKFWRQVHIAIAARRRQFSLGPLTPAPAQQLLPYTRSPTICNTTGL